MCRRRSRGNKGVSPQSKLSGRWGPLASLKKGEGLIE